MFSMIYLDNQATTSCDPNVVVAMMPFFTAIYGNAASAHGYGEHAAEATETAKNQISRLIKSDPGEILFTSGATESNNIALLGACRKHVQSGGTRRTLLTSPVEHKSVYEPLEQLRKEGWKIISIPIDRHGQIQLEEVKNLLNENVFLISLQLANSEIGTIQPIKEVSKIAHEFDTLVHCDASQAIGKLVVDVNDLGIHFMSFSAHKIYGPKGIGALWIKDQFERALAPIMFGGNPSMGIRPGTVAVPLAVGFGKACDILEKTLIAETKKIKDLRDSFESKLLSRIDNLRINGSMTFRLDNNSSITFPDVEADALLSNMPEIMASTNSACESGSIEPSRILTTIGMPREEAFNTIRFGFGRFNTQEQIDEATEQLILTYTRLSQL